MSNYFNVKSIRDNPEEINKILNYSICEGTDMSSYKDNTDFTHRNTLIIGEIISGNKEKLQSPASN